ncbi:MAG: YhjD/YihY/BrkB family envelope integrity protein [Casimicrobiaceae bacterium]
MAERTHRLRACAGELRAVSVLRAFVRWWRADGLVFSGSLAFLTLLALAPMLAAAFWLGQQHEVLKTGERALRDFLYSNLLPDAARQAGGLLDRLRANARDLGEVAIAVFLADILVKTLAIHVAFDRIFRVGGRGVTGHLRGALVLLGVIPAAVGGLYWLLRFIERLLLRMMPASAAWLGPVFEPIAIGIPLVLALALLYRYVPQGVHGWRAPFAAALVVAVALEAVRWGLSAYVANLAALRSLYGTAIAVPVFLASLLATWALVLLGAALVAERFAAGRGRPARS